MRMFRRRGENDPDRTPTDDRGAYADDRRAYTDGRGADTTTTDDGGRSTAVRDDRPADTTMRDDRGASAATARPAAVDDGRRWHHGPTRALMTLLGAGVAGLLAWSTTNISDKSTGGYWAVYGILAGAGLVLALSQLLGGWTKWGTPRLSPTVFLFAFVPTLIAVGWILLFHQPHSTLWRGHIMNWSGNLGIRGLVNDMGGPLLTMLSFGLGLVFGFCFDTTGARRAVPPAREPVAGRAPADADQPLARDRVPEEDRETVRS